MHASTNSSDFEFFGRISAKYHRKPKNIIWPLSEKISRDNSTLFYSCIILYFDGQILQKPIFSHLGRFGYKKAQKIQKFLFFQNLQNLSFLSIYTFMGIFLIGKKLCPFEIQSNMFYLVMDDPII